MCPAPPLDSLFQGYLLFKLGALEERKEKKHMRYMCSIYKGKDVLLDAERDLVRPGHTPMVRRH